MTISASYTTPWDMIEGFSYLIFAEGWIVAEILEQIQSADRKHKIIEGALEDKIPQPALGAHLAALKKMKQAQDLRNRLAHKKFVIRSDYEDCIVTVEGFGEQRKMLAYSLDNLKAASAFLVEAEAASQLMILTLAIQLPPRFEPGRLIGMAPMAFREVGEGAESRLVFQNTDGTWRNPDGSEYRE